MSRSGFFLGGLNCSVPQTLPWHVPVINTMPAFVAADPELFPLQWDLRTIHKHFALRRKIRWHVDLTDTFYTPNLIVQFDRELDVHSWNSIIVPADNHGGPAGEAELPWHGDNWMYNTRFDFAGSPTGVQMLFIGLAPDGGTIWRRTQGVGWRFYPQIFIQCEDMDFGLAVGGTKSFGVLTQNNNVVCTIYGERIPWYSDPLTSVAGEVTIDAPDADGYWEYRDANGLNPIYDGNTGQQLIAF